MLKSMLDPIDLEWLVGCFPKPGMTMIEVGSAFGGTAAALAERGVSVIAVDYFTGEVHMPLAHKGKDAPPFEADAVTLAGWQKQVVGVQDRVIPVVADSCVAAGVLAMFGVRADVVFIDANHSYESVVADIRAWRSLVRPGGILCGDDREQGGVRRAVQDTIGLYEVGERLWAIRL